MQRGAASQRCSLGPQSRMLSAGTSPSTPCFTTSTLACLRTSRSGGCRTCATGSSGRRWSRWKRSLTTLCESSVLFALPAALALSSMELSSPQRQATRCATSLRQRSAENVSAQSWMACSTAQTPLLLRGCCTSCGCSQWFSSRHSRSLNFSARTSGSPALQQCPLRPPSWTAPTARCSCTGMPSASACLPASCYRSGTLRSPREP
mmetsp:Transcript_5137/g.14358  ORF Transcript_5137/g.14358 Transcript_5137/m.14358 type:complete len:206 (+) Transcript_5137:767-1384(+)